MKISENFCLVRLESSVVAEITGISFFFTYILSYRIVSVLMSSA